MGNSQVVSGIKRRHARSRAAGVIFTVFLFFVLTVVNTLTADDTAGFKLKAAAAEKAMHEKEQAYIGLKKKYDAINLKIQGLKKEKESILRNITLGWYLGKGNDAGYALFRDEKEIKELKEDYFTYSALVLEDYNKKFYDCLKSKCMGLPGIYSERKKWAGKIINFQDVFRIEISLEFYMKTGSSEAAEDIKVYMNKKLEQVDQRIYMLNEEKNIMRAALKAGIEKTGTEGLDVKISELKKLRKEIENGLKK